MPRSHHGGGWLGVGPRAAVRQPGGKAIFPARVISVSAGGGWRELRGKEDGGREVAVLFYCCPGAGRSAPNTGVISATFGVAQVPALVGLPRAFVPKEVERRSLMLERGLVTTCLSRSERRRLPDKRKQQAWLL